MTGALGGAKGASALALAAALVLGGCVDLAPAYRRPPAPVPAALPAGGVFPPPAAGARAAEGWRTAFQDQKLKTLIGRALQDNRDLRSAAADVLAARSRYEVQRAALAPTVAASASAEYLSEPTAVAAGATFASGAFNERLYSLGAGVASYEVDFFGRLRNLARSAKDQYLASAAGRDALQITLVSEIADQYLQISADRALIEVSEKALRSGLEAADVTRLRYASGVDSELSVHQADTVVEQARFDLEGLRTQLQQDRDALDLLVGGPVDEALLPPPGPSEVLPPGALPQGLSSSVLLTRPDVVEAEDGLKAAHADIGAARAAFFPTLSLTASGGLTSLALSNLFKGASSTWTFAPTLSQPLFDGGANLGNLRLAKAERVKALATYEKAVQSAFRDVADALADRGTIESRLEAQRRLVASASAAQDIAAARYASGSDTYLNLLIAQRSLYGAEQTLVRAELARQENLVRLYAVLGGGLGA